MDRCPCRVHDGRRVVAARRRPTVCPARNEPPSQRDLRPAARRPSGGMPGGGGAGNPCRTVVRTGRQLNNNRIAADRSDVWGQRAVKRFLGATLPVGATFPAGPPRAARPGTRSVPTDAAGDPPTSGGTGDVPDRRWNGRFRWFRLCSGVGWNAGGPKSRSARSRPAQIARGIHDGNWQVRGGDFDYGLDRTCPHHPGRPGARHRDGSAPPAAPVHQRGGGTARARTARDQRASASSIDRRALAVARHHPVRDRDHPLADLGRLEHLEPRSDRQQPVRHLVRPADAQA